MCGLCDGVVNPDGAKQCCEPHLFCQSCIEQWQAEYSQCPVESCQSPIYFVGADGFMINTNVSADTKNSLNKLELKCSAIGCAVEMSMQEMSEHEASCPFQDVNVKSFVHSRTQRIKSLQSDLTLHQNKVRTMEKRLSDANQKLIAMKTAHEKEKSEMLEDQNKTKADHRVDRNRMLRYWRERNESRRNLDAAENDLENEKLGRHQMLSVFGRFFKKWQDHVTRVGFSGSFEDNSLIKAQGNRYKCNYCDEDQLSDKQPAAIRRHLERNHKNKMNAGSDSDDDQLAIDCE